MGSKNCMNEVCRATTSSEWKKGWGLKSGGFATLCYSCGSAYENFIFCKTFHLEESGWRECRICGKPIHCGCVASQYLHEYMDFGGVGCISCAKLENRSMQSTKFSCDVPIVTSATNGISEVRPVVVDNRVDDENFSTGKLLRLTMSIGTNDMDPALEQPEQDKSLLKNRESSKQLTNFKKQSFSSGLMVGESSRPKQGVEDIYESIARQSLSFSPMSPMISSSTLLPFQYGIVEGSEQSKGLFQPGKSRQPFLPKTPKPSPVSGPEMQRGVASQIRVARPPAEGRGRNQLLPRYWPRITDQELQQLSGDLKSTIVPLFEKTLSASDAGRIGRLVLPKACAEAYFPPINQSEGTPIRIQDIKGQEWTFQFRYWPNNNSRMYVLEGVTPCIQNMQMQAGDTVTFSQRDPGGQLVIGCRKATSNVEEQDSQTSVIRKCDSAGKSLTDNLLSNGGRMTDDLLQRAIPISEKKKSRNIKNKRLLMNTDDAVDLRITWDEAQELLRPSPAAMTSVVVVENHEFEEFDEPPVFGKRTIFTSRLSGDAKQLAQCDSCSKWRRLPVDALLVSKWTCSENIWDPNRCSCSSPEDVNPRDLGSLLRAGKDNRKKVKVSEEKAINGEPCGLDALATAAVLGDNIVLGMGESSTGATTRHPRHRPGCTCIVCIQPPSGKGKHEPTCKCNVCSTVKRRFKTLMLRKKKRQTEHEAELARTREKSPIVSRQENQTRLEDATEAQLDLNCDPHRAGSMLTEAAGMGLTAPTSAARLPPLDMCASQNDVTNVELTGSLSRDVAERKEA